MKYLQSRKIIPCDFVKYKAFSYGAMTFLPARQDAHVCSQLKIT
jgi:hypothetical protein